MAYSTRAGLDMLQGVSSIFHHQTERSQKAAGRPPEMAHPSQGLLRLLSCAALELLCTLVLLDGHGHEHRLTLEKPSKVC